MTTTNAPSQKHALLYLLLPHFFLPIAKSEHRSQIRAAFADKLGRPPGDLDEDLRRLYDSLVETAGKQVDLYQAPYREKWDPKAVASTTYHQGPWERFMGWAAKLNADVDLEAEERKYKLEVANRLDLARPRLLRNEPDRPVSLRSALNHGNLLDSAFKTSFFHAVDKHPEELRHALLRVWRDVPDPHLFSAFHAELKSLMDKGATPSNATALGSVLLMASDSARFPPNGPAPVEKARSLTSHPTAGTSPSARYDDLLTMCDEVLDRAADYGLELQDRLDAQGLIRAVATYAPPETAGPRTPVPRSRLGQGIRLSRRSPPHSVHGWCAGRASTAEIWCRPGSRGAPSPLLRPACARWSLE